MNTIKLRLASHRDVAMIFFVAAIFVLAVAYSVFSATTVSDNVNTGGTLTVSGASTLGHVYASSTVQSTGNVFAYSSLAIGTTTTGTRLALNAGTSLLAGDVYIYGKAMLPYLQATSTTASYFIGSLGIGTTTPGAKLSVTGDGVINDTLTVGGILKATSTALLATEQGGRVGIGTTTPSTAYLLAVHGSLLVSGTSTINGGGLITQGLFSTSSLAFYTTNTAAPRAVIEFGGNVGIATSGPATTLSTTGSGYFTSGLGVGYATTGSGNLLVNDLAVVKGRVGAFGTTSPYQEVGVAGDVVLGGDVGTSTLSVESTSSSRGGCIELRDSDGQWVSIYAGKGGATTTTSVKIIGGQIGGTAASNNGLLVIDRGRCEGGTD